MDHIFTVVFLGIISSLMVTRLDACMCAEDKHLQQHFCESDYVIKARILRMDAIYDTSGEIKMKIPRAMRYSIKLLKSFKIGMPNSQVPPLQETFVYTSVTSCGVPFSLGKTYLIAGPIRNGEQWTEVCNYSTEWRQVTPHQRKYMKFGRYSKHCACLPKMTRHRSKKYCSTTSAYWECFAKHSYCEISHKDRCRWQHNQPLSQCLWEREP